MYSMKANKKQGADETRKRRVMPRMKKLLDAADRLGCIDLKLQVEYDLATSILDISNAADLFCFADSHSCAFLKESAMRVFQSSLQKVKQTEGWSLVQESTRLLEEVLDAMHSPTRAGISAAAVNNTATSIDEMNVCALRNCAEEKGLDVDGSRATLIKRLKDVG